MKLASWLPAALILCATPAIAEEKREADAHEHGHGSFQMAIEEDHAMIELSAPAFDIIGFEHAPSTAEQRATMASAAAALSRPDILFAMPAAAGCAIAQIEIGFGATGGNVHEHGDHDDEDDHEKHEEYDDKDHDDHDHDDHAHDDHADDKEDTHSEVTASYRLACENPSALDQIDFGYFTAFPSAEELEVVILSAAGQSAGEVDASKTVFEIE